MDKAELKSFGKPDEVRDFPKGHLELVKIGGATIGRAVFEPGWRWATSVQPLAKTKSCEASHFQYHVWGECGFEWMTAANSIISRAMYLYYPPVMMRGLSANRLRQGDLKGETSHSFYTDRVVAGIFTAFSDRRRVRNLVSHVRLDPR